MENSYTKHAIAASSEIWHTMPQYRTWNYDRYSVHCRSKMTTLNKSFVQVVTMKLRIYGNAICHYSTGESVNICVLCASVCASVWVGVYIFVWTNFFLSIYVSIHYVHCVRTFVLQGNFFEHSKYFLLQFVKYMNIVLNKKKSYIIISIHLFW